MAVITDRSGQFVGGTADGLQRWRSLSEITPPGAAALSQVTGEAPFTDADATGLWILGHGEKYLSGAAAAKPGQLFPISAGFLAASPKMKLEVGAIFAINSIAFPDTSSIEVGFYPVTAAGAAGTLAYTLSTSGAIAETYGDGISGTSPYGRENPDRRADFVAGGDENYALGVHLVDALPTGCVLHVSVALLISPF